VIRRLGRFSRLLPADRARLVKAAFLIGAIKLGLWVLPFHVLRRLMAKLTYSVNDSHEVDQAAVARAVWAVLTAGRHMPWAITCLTRATAAQVLLGRLGEPTHLRLGVAKDEQGQLRAHAWLESGDEIIIGDEGDLSDFTKLPPLEMRLG